MEDFVQINGKKLKKGYTTGSCAAAAAKASVYMLLNQEKIEHIAIDTPSGVVLKLQVTHITLEGDYVICAIIKDGGDDPDITSGLLIFAKASINDSGNIVVTGGEGVGKVTLPGLKVAVGEYAINPVPMKMINQEVREVLPKHLGANIEIYVPEGEKIAQKTYNKKLGIIGGISILGTSGIVNPMSIDAWKESIELELSIAANKGKDKIVFVFGNIGEDFIENQYGVDKENIIKISNFIGFMLEKAVYYQFKKVLVAGHIGKLIKVSAGIFDTHSRIADARNEILTAYVGLAGCDVNIQKKVYSSNTTEEAVRIIEENNLNDVFNRIVKQTSKKCYEYTYGKIEVGSILFCNENRLLQHDEISLEIIRDLGGKFN